MPTLHFTTAEIAECGRIKGVTADHITTDVARMRRQGPWKRCKRCEAYVDRLLAVLRRLTGGWAVLYGSTYFPLHTAVRLGYVEPHRRDASGQAYALTASGRSLLAVVDAPVDPGDGADWQTKHDYQKALDAWNKQQAETS